MAHRARLAVVVAALALAVSGCGGSDGSSGDKPSAATVSAEPASGDTVTGTGYTFSAPKGWHKPSKKLPGFDPDSLVLAPTNKSGFTDNINVLRSDPTPVEGADALEQGSVQDLKKVHATNIKVLARQKVDRATAIHLTSSASTNGVKYVGNQFIMTHDKVLYAVTFSFSADVSSEHVNTITQSVMATWKWTS